jgi:hypothetical protein
VAEGSQLFSTKGSLSAVLIRASYMVMCLALIRYNGVTAPFVQWPRKYFCCVSAVTHHYWTFLGNGHSWDSLSCGSLLLSITPPKGVLSAVSLRH